MKVVSAHQPAYLPWLGFFHKILLSDHFVLMDDVQFEKNSFINRNRIISPNGTTWLTIPVSTQNYKQKTIREIRVAGDRWRSKHLRSLEQTYGKYPFFKDVMPIISQPLLQERSFLVDYLNPILFGILSYLEIKTPVTLASDLAINERKLKYVIALTHKVQGSHFVFGALGREYADETILASMKVTPYFQDYKHPRYKQRGHTFIPYLSIVDALFVKGRETLGLIQEDNIDRTGLGELEIEQA